MRTQWQGAALHATYKLTGTEGNILPNELMSIGPAGTSKTHGATLILLKRGHGHASMTEVLATHREWDWPKKHEAGMGF